MEAFIENFLNATRYNICKNLSMGLHSIIAVPQSIYITLIKNLYNNIPLMTGKADGTNRKIKFNKAEMSFTDETDGRYIFPHEILTQYVGNNSKPINKYSAEAMKLLSEGKPADNLFRYDEEKNYIGADINGKLIEPEKLAEKCNFCVVCDKVASSKCSKCLSVYYCSRECQSKDWSKHKVTCK